MSTGVDTDDRLVRTDSTTWRCPINGCPVDMKSEYPAAEDPAGALIRHLLDADDRGHRSVILAPAVVDRRSP